MFREVDLGVSARWVLFFFLFLLIQGSTLGLSDDEAYYWVLAQKPALGYAFHPPAVAWFIALIQKSLSWLLGSHSIFLVRLPAALGLSSVLAMSLSWIEELGITRKEALPKFPGVLISFAGLFGLAWMMVPDVPLFLGWTIAFVSTWRLCFGSEKRRDLLLLGVSSALLVLSKYSGILAVLSSLFCIWIWAPREVRYKAIGWVVSGLLLGLIPILVWNAQHEWASILYQIRDRHGGESWSVYRWMKFWLIEMVLAGPVVVVFFFVLCRSAFSSPTTHVTRVNRFLLAWVAPAAAVFCVQPLFSAFKPHWALIVWWPVVLGLAVAHGQARSKWIHFQMAYGSAVILLVVFSSHWPWLGQILPKISGTSYQMTWDVTNDFYGWSQLREQMSSSLEPQDLALPVVGSRYQTASQAAFSLSGFSQVTLIPRDLKERDEWPDLKITQHQGPSWPKLKRAVLFVTDNRYSEGPQFEGANCALLRHFDQYRWGVQAKWIELWRCVPRG